jgi:hypothetical protein
MNKKQVQKNRQIRWKYIQKIRPCREELNRIIREAYIEHGIEIDVYIKPTDSLKGKPPIIFIDVFKPLHYKGHQ